jgi:hypothetical protein
MFQYVNTKTQSVLIATQLCRKTVTCNNQYVWVNECFTKTIISYKVAKKFRKC